MNSLKLVGPSVYFKEQYIDMIEEWKVTGERMTPFVLRFDYHDFDRMLQELIKLREDPDDDGGTVSSSTFWLVNGEDRVLGAVNIRHTLNEYNFKVGGHIGYGIRPSERRKGYATQILRLALLEAKKLGLDRILVTCDQDNIGSAKTILNNGGVLDSEVTLDGVTVQRYWIDIK